MTTRVPATVNVRLPRPLRGAACLDLQRLLRAVGIRDEQVESPFEPMFVRCSMAIIQLLNQLHPDTSCRWRDRLPIGPRRGDQQVSTPASRRLPIRELDADAYYRSAHTVPFYRDGLVPAVTGPGVRGEDEESRTIPRTPEDHATPETRNLAHGCPGRLTNPQTS